MNPNLRSAFLLLGAAVLSTTFARAQLIDSYNADSLSLGSLTSWTDLTGSENATTANATSINSTTNASDPTVADTNSTFNGHNYVSFGTNQGLATANALFSGSASRSVAAVYNAPLGDNGGINPVAGESTGGVQGAWFMLQARTLYAAGSPYLAGFADDDVGSGVPPSANVLTFSIATYNQATEQEVVYWAYGLFGSVNTLTMQLGTSNNPVLDTAANPLTIGFDQGGELSSGDMQIGQVLVYENALTSTQATTEIESLQDYYGAPEPSTYALMGVSLLAGVIFLRRRAIS